MFESHVFVYLTDSDSIYYTTAEGFTYEELDSDVMDKVFIELENSAYVGFWATYPTDRVSYDSAEYQFNNAILHYKNNLEELQEVC